LTHFACGTIIEGLAMTFLESTRSSEFSPTAGYRENPRNYRGTQGELSAYRSRSASKKWALAANSLRAMKQRRKV